MSLPTDFGPDSGGRMKGISIVKPIVYGNIAKYFGQKREEDGHTHQWTVYLKPYNNEDMSTYVKKVHFKLHESYANPSRVVLKPPYEISETGWGEFELVIKIYFHDTNERPVTLYHILKLFHHSGTTENLKADDKAGLISESYDEIIFQDPSQLMHNFLINTKPLHLENNSGYFNHVEYFEEKKKKNLKAILEAQQKLTEEISVAKNKLKLAQETFQHFKEEVAKSQEAQGTI